MAPLRTPRSEPTTEPTRMSNLGENEALILILNSRIFTLYETERNKEVDEETFWNNEQQGCREYIIFGF